MELNRVPASLRERLGPEASTGLVALLNDAKAEWNSDVIGIVSDRFERRLVEETSKLRVELVQGIASLREEIGSLRQDLRHEIGDLRQDLRQEIGDLRQDLRQEIDGVRQEIAGVRQEISALRQELTDGRFELLKWAFLFWVGQFFAVAGLVAVLIRFLKPA